MTKKFKNRIVAFVALLLTFVAGTGLPFFSGLLPEYINEVNFSGAKADVEKYDLSSGVHTGA